MRCGIGCISVPSVNFVCAAIIGLTLVCGGGLVQAAPPTGGSDSSKAAPSRPPTPQEIDAAAKAEKERLANLAKAKAAAIPFLKMIVEKYPKSPRGEESAYKIAVLQYDLVAAGIDATGKPIAPEKIDQTWKDAAASLAKFCETYPKSQFAGGAYVRQIDIALERQFDAVAGEQISKKAVEWAKQASDSASTEKGKTDAEVWRTSRVPTVTDDTNEAIFGCFLRAGMIAYLLENYDAAVKMFDAGGAANPTEGVQGRFTVHGIGLFLLKTVSQKKMPVWFEDSLKVAVNDRQKLAIKLADLYIYARQPEKAADIYERFLAHDPVLAPIPAALESYCIMQVALAYSQNQKTAQKALTLYNSLYDPKFANCSWTPDGILRLGVLTYNTTHDPKKSMPHYEYVFTKYPDHVEAERALYFYCLGAVEIGDKATAERSIAEFLKKYPRSGWGKQIVEIQRDDLPKMKSDVDVNVKNSKGETK